MEPAKETDDGMSMDTQPEAASSESSRMDIDVSKNNVLAIISV